MMHRETPQGVDRIVALQYVAVIMLGFNNAFTILPVLAVERGVFYRERAAGYYSTLAYGLAQGDVEIPFLLLQSVIYTVIFYFMVHLEYSAGECQGLWLCLEASALSHPRKSLVALTFGGRLMVLREC